MKRLRQFLFKNTSARQTIVKNTFWLFFGEMLGRILKFGVVVFATRLLGTEGWGVFSYALAFVSLFYIFADIGINTFITRQLAKGGEDKYTYLSAALFLKLGLLVLSFIISILVIPYFGSVELSLHIVLAIALLNFSDSFREFALSVNRALEKMEREAFIKILMNGVITTLGVVLFLVHPTPLSLAIAYATGSIVASIVTIWAVSSEFKHVQWTFSLSKIKTIVNFSWPFIAITIFSTAMVTIDSIMLGQITSTTEVGLYAAGQRIIQFLAIIPIFIGISLFPIMSKSESDNETLTRIFEKTMTIVLAIGIPITLGGFLLSQQLMVFLFGSAFLGGGIVLAILMIAILADFPTIILNNAIFAKNLQKRFITTAVVGLVVNILFNIYLIPRYGAVGASISTVTSQLLITIINWRLLKQYLSFTVIPKLGKVILASIIMTAIVYIFGLLGVHVVLLIAIAACTYIVSLRVLREPALEQFITLITSRS